MVTDSRLLCSQNSVSEVCGQSVSELIRFIDLLLFTEFRLEGNPSILLKLRGSAAFQTNIKQHIRNCSWNKTFPEKSSVRNI